MLLDIWHTFLTLIVFVGVLRASELVKQAKLARKLYHQKKREMNENDARQVAALEEGKGEAVVIEGGEDGAGEHKEQSVGEESPGEAGGEGPGKAAFSVHGGEGEGSMSKVIELTPKSSDDESALIPADAHSRSRRRLSEVDQKAAQSPEQSTSQLEKSSEIMEASTLSLSSCNNNRKHGASGPSKLPNLDLENVNSHSGSSAPVPPKSPRTPTVSSLSSLVTGSHVSSRSGDLNSHT